MKKLLISLLLLNVGGMAAQTSAADPAAAEQLFRSMQYSSAVKQFEALVSAGKANGNIYYKLGRCYLASRSQKHKAAPLLEKAISESTSFYTHGLAKESDAPMDVFYYLGDAYRWQFKFREAISAYEKYKARLQETKTGSDQLRNDLDTKIAACLLESDMKDELALPPNITLAGLMDPEKAAGEFSSAMPADKNTIIYTIKVPVGLIRKYPDDRFFENSKIQTAVQKEEKNAKKKNTLKLQQDTVINVSTLGTSSDGQVMMTYRNESGAANLYSQRLSGNEWSPPVPIQKTVNKAGWETDEYLSADGTVLYFVSDRPGGYGGKDIYQCDLQSNGQWSKARNLGPDINTAFDETAPFLHPDNETFYFSSNRQHPANSYDIFRIDHKDGKWGKAVVCGYPVNSGDKNLFYQVKEKPGLVASTENKGQDLQAKLQSEKNIRNLSDTALETDTWRDNYMLSLAHEESGRSLLLRGKINSGTEKMHKAVSGTVTVQEAGSGKVLQTCVTDQQGNFALILPERTCLLTYTAPGHLPYSELVELKKKEPVFVKHGTILLPEFEKGISYQFSSIQFRGTDEVPDKKAYSEITMLARLINEHPEVKWRLESSTRSPFKKDKESGKQHTEQLRRMLRDAGVNERSLEVKNHFTKSKLDKNLDEQQNVIQTYQLSILSINKQ